MSELVAKLRWTVVGEDGARGMGRMALRYLCFVTGLLINSFGVAFITKAALGTSPISSIPYVLDLRFQPTFGEFTFVLNMVYIVAQVVLLRKDFQPIQLLQVVANLIASESICIAGDPGSCVQAFESYPYVAGMGEFANALPHASREDLDEAHMGADRLSAIQTLYGHAELALEKDGAKACAPATAQGNDPLEIRECLNPDDELTQVRDWVRAQIDEGTSTQDIAVIVPGTIWERRVAKALLAGPSAEGVDAVILWELRLPMTLTALFVGTSLALAGLEIQNITGNALASPSTLGVTSAASFGAALAITAGMTFFGQLWIGTTAAAFLFALLVSGLIYALSERRGMTPQTVILAGIVMNFFFLALQQLLLYGASPETAQLINGWTFGNLERSSGLSAAAAAGFTLVAALWLLPRAWAMTALTIGEERARSLGVAVARLRVEAFLLSALLIAGAVSFIGTIGFVGLVAPHFAKLTLGDDQRFLIPGTILAGGLLMTASSVAAKLLSTGAVLPVGIVTSLVGVPFLFLLLLRETGGAR